MWTDEQTMDKTDKHASLLRLTCDGMLATCGTLLVNCRLARRHYHRLLTYLASVGQMFLTMNRLMDMLSRLDMWDMLDMLSGLNLINAPNLWLLLVTAGIVKSSGLLDMMSGLIHQVHVAANNHLDLVRFGRRLNDGLNFFVALAGKWDSVPFHHLVALSNLAKSVHHSAGQDFGHVRTVLAVRVGNVLAAYYSHSEPVAY